MFQLNFQQKTRPTEDFFSIERFSGCANIFETLPKSEEKVPMVKFENFDSV